MVREGHRARSGLIRPVALVSKWLDDAGIVSGPVFRPVSRLGNVRQSEGVRLTI